jgi:hypothetical protein
VEAPSADADLCLSLEDEDRLGLHILATLEGVARDDGPGFAEVAAATMRRGMRARFDSAGLTWPPGPDALERASEFAAIADQDAGTAERQAASGPASTRVAAAAGLIVAGVIVLVGGYGLSWSWTGLPGNDQVWDWMHLLLLPVALGLFPLWLAYSGYMSTMRVRVFAAAVLAFLAFVLVGYVGPLVWTGFRGQTLWSWLTLMLLPLALALASVRGWPKRVREVRRHHVVFAVTLLAAWVVTLIGGYAAGWTWTGYAGNTLWDWVSLLLGPLAITTIVVPQLVRRLSGDVATLAEAEEQRRARTRAMAEARARAADL